MSSSIQSSSPNVAFHIDYIDDTVDRTQDFYGWANGKWLATAKIPPGFSSWSMYTELQQKTDLQMVAMLQNQKKHPPEHHYEQLVYAVYNSALNQDQREAVGITPIEDILNEISHAETVDEVILCTSYLYHDQALPFFGQFTDPHPTNPEVLTAFLDEGGMHLPNHVDYDNESKLKYLFDYAKQLFILAGYSAEKADEGANAVVTIETRLAKACLSNEDKLDPTKTNNVEDPMNISDNPTTSNNFRLYFESLDIREGEIVLTNPHYFDVVSAIWNETPIEMLKAYMSFTVLDRFSTFLTASFNQAQFQFYSVQLKGVAEPKSKEETCLEIVNDQLLEAAGRMWIGSYYPLEKKEKLRSFAALIHETFLERVSQFTWMREETHQNAILKAKRLSIQPAFPDEGYWKDYDGLNGVEEELPLGQNMRFAMRYNAGMELKKIGTPPNEKHWLDTCWKANFYWKLSPQQANAYHKFKLNCVYLPGGYYQDSMFGGEDPSYFGTGAVSNAHEAFHSIDPTGCHYSPDNKVENWWTKSDHAHFDLAKEKVIQQFDNYQVTYSDGTTENINGALTCRENMADQGGLLVAYDAMHKSMKGKEAEIIDGFTPEQRFFIAYAQKQRSVMTDKALQSMVKTNEHAPGRQRVNGNLAQTPAFWDAFGIPEGSPMRVSKALKSHIWETPSEKGSSSSKIGCSIS